MRRVRRRALLILTIAAACIFSGGTSSSLARFTSTKSEAANFTTGYWGCMPGSATLSTANGSTVHDTYVDQKNPTTSYGSAQTLIVSSTPGASAKEKRMLFQFSSLPPIPAGCSFKTATLTVWTSVAAAGLTYHIYNPAAAWADTVTWNTQPAASGSPVSVATNGAIGSTAWVVTALVSAQYAGSFNRGFLVMDSVPGTNATTSYASNEAPTVSQRPTLTITWAP